MADKNIGGVMALVYALCQMSISINHYCKHRRVWWTPGNGNDLSVFS